MPPKPGFIQLAPHTDFTAPCPTCGAASQAIDWYVPGLWTVAELKCSGCKGTFFQDLPYSLGVVSPFVFTPETGKATALYSGQWYADLIADAWKKRVTHEVPIRVLRNPKGKQACLVNCLYPWWGDAVSLLLRVNQIRNSSDIDIIVLINPALQWLVPDFVSGVWLVEQGVLKNILWNESISSSVKSLAASLGLELFLPVIFQPAYLTPSEVHEATKIAPFPRHEWSKRLAEKPTVTFMWRTDRTWSQYSVRRPRSFTYRFFERIGRKFRLFSSVLPDWLANREQLRNVSALAEELRRVFPKLEFAVCGIGKVGELPSWIKDLRTDAFAADTNHVWSTQAANSHALCGVHGSHLMLGCFSGCYIELTPNDRLRNMLNCAPVTAREPRDAIYTHRFLPSNVDPLYLADVVGSILCNYSYVDVAFRDEYCKPLTLEALETIRKALDDRRAALSPLDPADRDRLGN